MITYQEFKEIFTDRLSDYFPKDGTKREIVVTKRYKVNEQLDAIYVLDESQKSAKAYVPTLYMEDLYKIYYSGTNLEMILKYVAEILLEAEPPKELTTATEKMRNWEKEVTAVLINREKNKELLKSVAYTPFLDLAVIYRISIAAEEQDTCHSFIITNDMLDDWDISISDLHKVAVRNTEEKEDVLLREPIPGKNEASIHMLSFRSHRNGASAILLKTALKKASERFNGNYYILPASIHEVFLVKEREGQSTSWRECVRSANETLVAPDDFLSNSLYRYNADTGEVEVA